MSQKEINIDSLSDLRNLELPFNVDKVDPQCHECIRRQLEKYKNFVDIEENHLGDKFLIPCSGIPKDHLNPELKSSFDPETWEELEALADIVKWAKKYLVDENGKPWEARWYQEKVLRCTSRRTALRIARRTGKTTLVCVGIIYDLCTKKNFKGLVVGPQKSHTEEIFNRVKDFFARNPDLSKMIIRNVSAPYYELKLSNGSRLRGFAGGTKGKKEGTSIRGQDADTIYLEEADYIDQNAITGAILPILQTTPDTKLVAFSTPIGFKTPFYHLCQENPFYVEYFYNYKVLPHWKNVEMERSQFTQEEWEHEYLALFSSSEAGVYKPSYIDRAIKVYDYDSISRNNNWRYCIGTDWNEKHGTEIVVLGYNIFTRKFQVVEAILVTRSEFTQLAGVQKLLELNKKWKPSFIYIDAGNGSTNAEILRKTAWENRHPEGDRDTARLLDILKKYDSGSSIEHRDPVSHEKIKVPAKPFMVNASVRMFEQDKIIISAKDLVLEKQLRNYLIERYTPSGSPVYGLEDAKVLDHRLDALNLSIVAFHLEFNDLYQTKMITSVGATPDPRTIGTGNRNYSSSKEEYGKQINSQPEDRRLENASSGLHSTMPGRIDGLSGRIQTDRIGWSIDKEPEYRAEWLQKKRSRVRMSRERPRRDNF